MGGHVKSSIAGVQSVVPCFFAILNHNMSTQSQTDPKVVLISGGSDGLGKVVAEQLSATHKVVILARTQHLLKNRCRDWLSVGPSRCFKTY